MWPKLPLADYPGVASFTWLVGSKGGNTMASGRARILVAEDDADQREILSELLSREGYEVRCAASAEEVIERLDDPPDVVLLDVHGVVTPAVTRSLEEQPAPPAVVLISGDSRISEWAKRLRADAQLAKPFDLTDLLGTVAAVLRGRTLARRVLSQPFA